jgi:hypothetical protein
VAFTPAEVAQIKAYLGYPTLARSELLDNGLLVTGGTEHMYIIEANIQQVQEAAEPLVREQMKRIACIVQQQQASYTMQQVSSAGGVSFNWIRRHPRLEPRLQPRDRPSRRSRPHPKAPTSLLHQRIGGSGQGAVIEPC